MSALAPLFDLHPATRVLFGANLLDRVGETVHALGGRRVLLVTDPGIVQAGHADRAMARLRAADLTVVTYDRVRENPTTGDVAACLAVAQQAQIDSIVGLGGGSSMDTAKGCNFLLTNGGRMQDYWGTGKAAKPMLPLVAIPTTAGTGSECQSYALIADEDSHQKMACGDPKAAPRVAILDPVLTLTQPRPVTACTGIDTLAHAVESAVTTRSNSVSQRFSHEAFRLAITALPAVLADPRDLEARSNMLLAAAYGGAAIENSMLGCCHAMANPLTARFGIIHGRAVGLMLPHSVRFNSEMPEARARYFALALHAGLVAGNADPATGVAALLERLAQIYRAADQPTNLQACGVPWSAIATMADEAARQWTAQFNPRPVSAEACAAMYRQALAPEHEYPVTTP